MISQFQKFHNTIKLLCKKFGDITTKVSVNTSQNITFTLCNRHSKLYSKLKINHIIMLESNISFTYVKIKL